MLTFIMTHLDDILIAVSAVVAAASAVCALTPTPKDDAFCQKIRSFLDVLALNVGQARKNG